MPTVSARPVRATRVARVLAVLLVAVFSAVATTLRGPTDSGKSVFQTGDQVAMIALGVLAALGVLLFTRPRVSADESGIRVRNVIGSYDLPWDLVRAVEFRRGSPWASLELVNDDVIAIMAVQAADRQRAVVAVRGLRALLDAAHGTAADPPGAAGPADPPGPPGPPEPAGPPGPADPPGPGDPGDH
jgi:Bacterial PH domain